MMNYTRIAKLHNRVFSTPRNSPEREQAIAALNETDLAAVFDYDMGLYSGRIKKLELNEQEESGNMIYEQFKSKMQDDYKGKMLELSQFSMESPVLYQNYKERYQSEQDEEQRLHNRKLTESAFINKPYSLK